MNQSLWIAKTGLEAQQTRMSVVSNNLANVNTTGFKRSNVAFQDLLYQNVRQAGGQTSQDTQLPSGLMFGTGTKVVSTEKQYSQGNIVQSDNPLNVAIEGRGFFQVLMPDGTLAYTRDGSFQLDSQGQLVTSTGYQVQPAITIPDGSQAVTIGNDGTVSVSIAGQASPTQVGSLQLADFINPAGLQPVGENLAIETAASGSPQTGTPGLNGLGKTMQGSLETSNVNVVQELVDMIETQRAYEMNSRAVQSTDQMLSFIVNNI